jgi:hypothetical protein
MSNFAFPYPISDSQVQIVEVPLLLPRRQTFRLQIGNPRARHGQRYPHPDESLRGVETACEVLLQCGSPAKLAR